MDVDHEGTSGTGGDVVQISVTANSTESARTGTLTIAGIAVAVMTSHCACVTSAVTPYGIVGCVAFSKHVANPQAMGLTPHIRVTFRRAFSQSNQP